MFIFYVCFCPSINKTSEKSLNYLYNIIPQLWKWNIAILKRKFLLDNWSGCRGQRTSTWTLWWWIATDLGHWTQLFQDHHVPRGINTRSLPQRGTRATRGASRNSNIWGVEGGEKGRWKGNMDYRIRKNFVIQTSINGVEWKKADGTSCRKGKHHSWH